MFPPQRGVALIVTLIMISVITFMAITFLALSRREKGQVSTTTDQLTAQLAAAAAFDRAKAQMLATIFATTNAASFDLLVSTNFVNRYGYFSGINNPTNVNYEAAAALNSLAEQQRNLANLWYSPRAPVFITNKFYGSNEFRYSIDLNRDGVHTPNGWSIVTNANGGFYDTNGAPMPASSPPPPNTLSNYSIGDPEFIGILRRADRPHSSTNEFLSRYAFIVIPAGRTLDVNYIHNHAKSTPRVQDGFYRNQGVGGWEINLAAFLADLNTNIWGLSQYVYDTNRGFQSRGLAFQDAASITKYRYGYDVGQLYSIRTLYGAPGDLAVRSDGIDDYSAGPLMMSFYPPLVDPDIALGVRTASPWSGANNTNHFFTTQDLLDPAKTGVGAGSGNTFVDRMKLAQNFSPSSYDHSTYYRLLAQLGTDSAPEPDTKLNLNYINIAPFKATNFVAWNDPQMLATIGRPGSEVFFYNAADRLVRRYSEEWRDLNFRSYNNILTYSNTFGTDQPFGASRIPVFVNGRFVYSPSLHRQLQLAANLWDGLHGTKSNACGQLPTVFRPLFTNDNGNIYINDFKEVAGFNELQGLMMRDLGDTNVVNSVQRDDLLFGVPLILGVKKGLPNFNEFAAETVIQITRKLELRKSDPPGGGNTIIQTNQMFVIGISNTYGAEFWNSYTKNYGCPVQVVVTNICTVSLTNDYGYNQSFNLSSFGAAAPFPWAAWDPRRTDPPVSGPWSFIVPLRTNHVIIADAAYRQSGNRFDQLTTSFERPSGFAFPRWGLAITNRVIAIIREPGATGRIIDYVQLNGMTSYRDLSLDIAQPGTALGIVGVWGTNSPAGGGFLSGQPGIIQQIQISKGEVDVKQDWQNYGVAQAAGQTKYQAIANFLAFFEPSHTYTYQPGDGIGGTFYGTNFSTVATAPFTPTSKRSIPTIWQANDPLVHYTSGDMEFLEKSGVPISWTPPLSNTNTLYNLFRLNERYRPWGNYPRSSEDDKLAYHTVVKDPGVTRSGDWQFPTNKLPGLGWLGRIHRGTPWQTVYLKSSRVADAVQTKSMTGTDWQKWTGNRNVWTDRNGKFPVPDPLMTQPETDRAYLDLFTTALNDNASRGQLPINQTGLAAWSAVLGGIVALTNTTSDGDLTASGAPLGFDPLIIDPAGSYDPANTNTWGAVKKIVEAINQTRTNFPGQTFQRLGDLLATPALTEASPFLNHSDVQKQQGLSDVAYEWLPQQMLSLVRLGEARFVIYSYGQTLKPAPRGTLVSGPYSGMVTNYQITAEVATRAVVRVVGSPDPDTVIPGNPKYQSDPDKRYPPRIVVENFNVLPPD